MSGSATRPDHFATGGRSWNKLGYPLRPGPADTAVVEAMAQSMAARPLRALILGLTQETVGLDWPTGTELLALDHSPEMMARLWPAPRAPEGARARIGDWCAMPLPDASYDVVAGDGCFALLTRPDGYAQTLAEVRRILAPDGRFAIRVFTRPERTVALAEIGETLRRGEVASVNSLKLRLWAHVHGQSGRGVKIDDVWQVWDQLRALAPTDRPGFTALEITGIENYRGQQTRYELPTAAEFRAAFAPWFSEVDCVAGVGDLGELCPTWVLAPR